MEGQRLNFVNLLILLFGVSSSDRCDSSTTVLVQEGNIGQSGDFKWLGLLTVDLRDEDDLRLAMTGIVLIKMRYAIANADDVAKIPHDIFESDSRAMFIPARGTQWYAKPASYVTHPEYGPSTLNSIALIKFNIDEKNDFPLNPICLPSDKIYKTSRYVYLAGLTDENQVFEKVIYKIKYLYKNECEEFYNRPESWALERIPTSYLCGYAPTNATQCIWDNGMALVSNDSGYFHLIGFGVHGLGCTAPARFISLFQYFHWINNVTSLDEVYDHPSFPSPGQTLSSREGDDEFIPIHELFTDARHLNLIKHDYEPYPFDVKTLDYHIIKPTNDNKSILISTFDNKWERYDDACELAKTSKPAYQEYFEVKVPRDKLRGSATYKLSMHDLQQKTFVCIRLTILSNLRSSDIRISFKEEIVDFEENIDRDQSGEPEELFKYFPALKGPAKKTHKGNLFDSGNCDLFIKFDFNERLKLQFDMFAEPDVLNTSHVWKQGCENWMDANLCNQFTDFKVEMLEKLREEKITIDMYFKLKNQWIKPKKEEYFAKLRQDCKNWMDTNLCNQFTDFTVELLEKLSEKKITKDLYINQRNDWIKAKEEEYFAKLRKDCEKWMDTNLCNQFNDFQVELIEELKRKKITTDMVIIRRNGWIEAKGKEFFAKLRDACKKWMDMNLCEQFKYFKNKLFEELREEKITTDIYINRKNDWIKANEEKYFAKLRKDCKKWMDTNLCNQFNDFQVELIEELKENKITTDRFINRRNGWVEEKDKEFFAKLREACKKWMDMHMCKQFKYFKNKLYEELRDEKITTDIYINRKNDWIKANEEKYFAKLSKDCKKWMDMNLCNQFNDFQIELIEELKKNKITTDMFINRRNGWVEKKEKQFFAKLREACKKWMDMNMCKQFKYFKNKLLKALRKENITTDIYINRKNDWIKAKEAEYFSKLRKDCKKWMDTNLCNEFNDFQVELIAELKKNKITTDMFINRRNGWVEEKEEEFFAKLREACKKWMDINMCNQFKYFKNKLLEALRKENITTDIYINRKNDWIKAKEEEYFAKLRKDCKKWMDTNSCNQFNDFQVELIKELKNNKITTDKYINRKNDWIKAKEEEYFAKLRKDCKKWMDTNLCNQFNDLQVELIEELKKKYITTDMFFNRRNGWIETEEEEFFEKLRDACKKWMDMNLCEQFKYFKNKLLEELREEKITTDIYINRKNDWIKAEKKEFYAKLTERCEEWMVSKDCTAFQNYQNQFREKLKKIEGTVDMWRREIERWVEQKDIETYEKRQPMAKYICSQWMHRAWCNQFNEFQVDLRKKLIKEKGTTKMWRNKVHHYINEKRKEYVKIYESTDYSISPCPYFMSDRNMCSDFDKEQDNLNSMEPIPAFYVELLGFRHRDLEQYIEETATKFNLKTKYQKEGTPDFECPDNETKEWCQEKENEIAFSYGENRERRTRFRSYLRVNSNGDYAAKGATVRVLVDAEEPREIQETQSGACNEEAPGAVVMTCWLISTFLRRVFFIH